MKDTTRRPTILIVGDERVCELLLQWLPSLYAVMVSTTPLHTLQLLTEFRPALLLLATQVDEISGIDLYDLIHKQPEYASIPALIFGPDLAPYQSALNKRDLMSLRTPLEKHTFLDVVHHLLHEPHSTRFGPCSGHDTPKTSED